MSNRVKKRLPEWRFQTRGTMPEHPDSTPPFSFTSTEYNYAATGCDFAHRRHAGDRSTTDSGGRYYGYRYYNPGLGRWVNRDPMAEKGGMNVYSLLSNGPISNIDYNGLYCCVLDAKVKKTGKFKGHAYKDDDGVEKITVDGVYIDYWAVVDADNVNDCKWSFIEVGKILFYVDGKLVDAETESQYESGIGITFQDGPFADWPRYRWNPRYKIRITWDLQQEITFTGTDGVSKSVGYHLDEQYNGIVTDKRDQSE